MNLAIFKHKNDVYHLVGMLFFSNKIQVYQYFHFSFYCLHQFCLEVLPLLFTCFASLYKFFNNARWLVGPISIYLCNSKRTINIFSDQSYEIFFSAVVMASLMKMGFKLSSVPILIWVTLSSMGESHYSNRTSHRVSICLARILIEGWLVPHCHHVQLKSCSLWKLWNCTGTHIRVPTWLSLSPLVRAISSDLGSDIEGIDTYPNPLRLCNNNQEFFLLV